MASGSPRSYDRDRHTTPHRAADGRTPADRAGSDEPQPVRAAANCVCRPDIRGIALADLENVSELKICTMAFMAPGGAVVHETATYSACPRA